jgi:hypothetical protein
MYTKADTVGWEQSNAFKKTFSIDVDIEFVGVWFVFHAFSHRLSTAHSLKFVPFQGYRRLSGIDTTPTPIHDFQYRNMHIQACRFSR